MNQQWTQKKFWCKNRSSPECVANLNTPQVLNERPLDVHKCINLKGEKERKSLLYYLLCLIISKKLIISKCSPWLVLPVAPSSAPVVSSPRLSSGSIPPPKPQLSSDRIVCYCHLNMLILMERSADRAFYSQPFSRNYSTTCTSEPCPSYVSFFMTDLKRFQHLSQCCSIAPQIPHLVKI